MKNVFRATLIALATVFVAGCSNPPAPQGPTDTELIAAADELDRQFIEAYNNGDVDAMMALYWNSPELAVYLPGEMVVTGYDQVQATFAKAFEMGADATLELNDSKNIVFGSAVLGHGLWTWTMTVPDSEPVTGQGRYTDMKVMVDGKMVYVSDHASMPMPPMPEATEDTTAAAI